MERNKVIRTIYIIAFLGAAAVALGAFGAHGLKPKISAKLMSTYQTGVAYHMYHTLGMLGILALAIIRNKAQYLKCIQLFTGGILLFSGSLYLLALEPVFGADYASFVGPITPIGGVLFIVGWLILARIIHKDYSSSES